MGQTGSSNQPPAQISGNVPMGRTPNDDGVTWWCRFLARGVAVIGGLVGMITGVAACFTITPICLVAGILLVLMGLIVVMLESPCCCPFLDFIQPIGRFADRRPHWQKALMYGLPSLLPVVLCFELTTMFGSGLIMAGAVLYGLMALGTKADRDTMLNRARGEDVEMKATLMENEERTDSQPQ